MKRNEISVETLKAKGYRDYDFTDFGMEAAVERIKDGVKCELVPSFTGSMVAVITFRIGCNEYKKEAFYRPMTNDEKMLYAEKMHEDYIHFQEVTGKINARNRAKLRKM